MNKNLIFNIVLAVYVVILSIAFFTSKNDTTTENELATATEEEAATTTPEIVSDTFSIDALKGSSFLVVNMDYINENYTYISKKTRQIEQRQKKFVSKQQNYQNELAKLENDIIKRQQSGAYVSQAAMEVDYKNFQEKAYKYQEELAQEEQRIMESTAAIQNELKKTLKDFFNRYGNEMEADMIIYSGDISNVIYSNEKLDISKDVVDRLNAEYSQGK